MYSFSGKDERKYFTFIWIRRWIIHSSSVNINHDGEIDYVILQII